MGGQDSHEALDSMLKVSPTPETHRLLTEAKFEGNSGTGELFGCHENEACPNEQSARKGSGVCYGCEDAWDLPLGE